MIAAVFAAHAVCTLAMFGLIWFVQVVHYPLFLGVGEEGFPVYAGKHADRTSYVVGPLMLVELATSAAVLFSTLRPALVRPAEAWAGLLLLVVVWASTAFLQVPLHNRLQLGYSAPHIRRLVATNWIRTAGWSLRAVLMGVWLVRLSRAAVAG